MKSRSFFREKFASGIRNTAQGIRNPTIVIRKCFARETQFSRENFASGIRNTAQGIRNPTNNWNPKCKVHSQSLESGIHSVESRI